MSEPRRVFSKEFKLQVLEEIEDGTPIIEVCRRYDLQRSSIWKWQQKLIKAPDNPFPGKGVRYAADSRKVAELERMVGRLTVENDFLKNALLRLRQRER